MKSSLLALLTALARFAILLFEAVRVVLLTPLAVLLVLYLLLFVKMEGASMTVSNGALYPVRVDLQAPDSGTWTAFTIYVVPPKSSQSFPILDGAYQARFFDWNTGDQKGNFFFNTSSGSPVVYLGHNSSSAEIGYQSAAAGGAGEPDAAEALQVFLWGMGLAASVRLFRAGLRWVKRAADPGVPAE